MRPQAFGKTNGFLAKFKIKEAWIELLLLTHVCHDTSVFGQNVGGGNRKGRRRRRKCASALLLSPLTLHNRREFFAEEGCRVSRAVEKESRVLHILHLERTHTHMLQTMSSGLLPDGPPPSRCGRTTTAMDGTERVFTVRKLRNQHLPRLECRRRRRRHARCV